MGGDSQGDGAGGCWGRTPGRFPQNLSSSPGPVGSALSTKFGPRPVVMAGGILAALGMLLASFATSLTHLYLSIGLLSGETLGKGRRVKSLSLWPLDFLPSSGCFERLREKPRERFGWRLGPEGLLKER